LFDIFLEESVTDIFPRKALWEIAYSAGAFCRLAFIERRICSKNAIISVTFAAFHFILVIALPLTHILQIE